MTRPDLADSHVIRFFMVVALLVYADAVNAMAASSLGTERYFKYAYFGAVVAIYGWCVMTGSGLRARFDAPTILAGFTALALIPFLLQSAAGLEVNSYASAFAAPLLYAISAVFAVRSFDASTERLERSVYRLLAWLCVLYTAELAVRKFSSIGYFARVINETNHIKSIAFVALIGLAVLRGHGRGVLLALALLALSAILRPSSSVILAVAICAPVAYALRKGWFRTVGLVGHGMIALAACVPLALYAIPELEAAILAAEAWLKEDVLQGQSNTAVRLAIKNAALDRWQDSSFLFGEFFSGATNVQIAHVFPWWLKEHSPFGLAAIHSDYVSMLLQGGIVGYLLFNLALALALSRAIAHARRHRALGLSAGLPGLGVLAVLILVLYGSSNPFLQYFGVAHLAWFLLFLSNLAGRAVQPDHAEGSGRSGFPVHLPQAPRGVAGQA